MFSGLPNSITEWEFKRLSNEKFNPFTASHSISPKLVLVWINNSRIRLEFNRSCLKKDKVTFTPSNLVKLFIFYELDTWSLNLNAGFTLKDCWFGSVKLINNADSDKYKYSDYSTWFDSRFIKRQ